MKRSLGLSVAFLVGWWLVGCVLKAEAAGLAPQGATVSVVQQADEPCSDDDSECWSLFAASSSAQ